MDIRVSHLEIESLFFCGKHWNDLKGIDKLSDHGIKQNSIIAMLMKCVMTDEMSNSIQLNKKSDFADNSFDDFKSDKRFKGNK